MPAALTNSLGGSGAAARNGPAAWIAQYRWPLIGALLLVGSVLALGVATYRPDWLRGSATDAAGRLADSIGRGTSDAAKTVAGLFDLRSPGERAAGALASLKNKRQPILHERALPKVRRPLSPLAAIVAAPPPPIATVPVFEAVGGSKPGLPLLPVALTTIPGGPPVIPGFSPPPGIFVPPPTTITPPGTPGSPTPTPSGVPEPTSWAMMLMGFAMIAGGVRLRAQASPA